MQNLYLPQQLPYLGYVLLLSDLVLLDDGLVHHERGRDDLRHQPLLEYLNLGCLLSQELGKLSILSQEVRVLLQNYVYPLFEVLHISPSRIEAIAPPALKLGVHSKAIDLPFERVQVGGSGSFVGGRVKLTRAGTHNVIIILRKRGW